MCLIASTFLALNRTAPCSELRLKDDERWNKQHEPAKAIFEGCLAAWQNVTPVSFTAHVLNMLGCLQRAAAEGRWQVE